MDVSSLTIRDVPGGCVLAVKAVPGSSRDRLAGVLGSELKVAVSAAPEKGKANAAIAAVLARAAGLDKRQVSLATGPTHPHKEFRFAAMTAEQLRRRLAAL